MKTDYEVENTIKTLKETTEKLRAEKLDKKKNANTEKTR